MAAQIEGYSPAVRDRFSSPQLGPDVVIEIEGLDQTVVYPTAEAANAQLLAAFERMGVKPDVAHNRVTGYPTAYTHNRAEFYIKRVWASSRKRARR